MNKNYTRTWHHMTDVVRETDVSIKLQKSPLTTKYYRKHFYYSSKIYNKRKHDLFLFLFYEFIQILKHKKLLDLIAPGKCFCVSKVFRVSKWDGPRSNVLAEKNRNAVISSWITTCTVRYVCSDLVEKGKGQNKVFKVPMNVHEDIIASL